MAGPKQKNRRFRNSKISEYRLRRVVECFAKDMTVADTARETKLAKPTIDAIFMRLRERLLKHGLVSYDFKPGEPHPARFIFNRKHRGVPEKYHDLYSAELVNRILCAQQLQGFEELSASNPAHVKKATKLQALRQNGVRRYNVLERLKPAESETEPKTVPFSPLDYREDSTILINERKLDPRTAFFRYLWDLLLRHPL